MSDEQLAQIFDRRSKGWSDASEDHAGATREMMWWLATAMAEIAEEIREAGTAELEARRVGA